MSTEMPRDDFGAAVPVLGLAAAYSTAFDATTSQRIGPFATGVRVVTLRTDGPVYIKFGDSSVVADSSDHFIAGGEILDLALGDGSSVPITHIAVLGATGTGVLNLSERV